MQTRWYLPPLLGIFAALLFTTEKYGQQGYSLVEIFSPPLLQHVLFLVLVGIVASCAIYYVADRSKSDDVDYVARRATLRMRKQRSPDDDRRSRARFIRLGIRWWGIPVGALTAFSTFRTASYGSARMPIRDPELNQESLRVITIAALHITPVSRHESRKSSVLVSVLGHVLRRRWRSLGDPQSPLSARLTRPTLTRSSQVSRE